MHDGADIPLALEGTSLENTDRHVGVLADVHDLDLLVDAPPQALIDGLDLGLGHIGRHCRLRMRRGREHDTHRHDAHGLLQHCYPSPSIPPS